MSPAPIPWVAVQWHAASRLCWKELKAGRPPRTIAADGWNGAALERVLRGENRQLPPSSHTTLGGRMEVSMRRFDLVCAFLLMGVVVPGCLLAQERPAIDRGVAEIAGTRLMPELAGSGDPVVLIHGAWGDLRNWDEQFGVLALTNRVLRYDVRGHGQSSPPVEGVAYSDEEDLANLLDHLRIRNPHVVGFSMGARIAVDYVLAYPGRSRSVVMVGPVVSGYSSPQVRRVQQSVFENWRSAQSEGTQGGGGSYRRRDVCGERWRCPHGLAGSDHRERLCLLELRAQEPASADVGDWQVGRDPHAVVGDDVGTGCAALPGNSRSTGRGRAGCREDRVAGRRPFHDAGTARTRESNLV